MFNQKCFEVFDIEGLEPRMRAVRSEIQPVFAEIGSQIVDQLSSNLTEEFYLHIAQHRRRTANAPENTWAGISTQKRGYKMEPHFQLGIWQNYVFVYLSIIDQPKGQAEFAKILSEISVKFDEDFVISKDHTKAEFFSIPEFDSAVERLSKVKKSELEIGRIWKRERFDGSQDDKILSEMLQTVEDLLPVYRKLMKK